MPILFNRSNDALQMEPPQPRKVGDAALQARQDLRKGGHPTDLANPRLERRPIDVFHNEVEPPLVRDEVIERNDVRVPETSLNLSLIPNRTSRPR